MAGHRDAILARRALFLSTALATMGCPPKEPGPKDPVPTATVTTSTAPVASSTAPIEPPPSNAPWKDVMKKAPPLDVPPVAAAREKTYLRSLAKEMKTKYELIRKVWTQTPGCDPTAHDCKDWEALSKDYREMFLAVDGSRFPGSCEGAIGITWSFAERRRAHERYIGALVKQLEEHLDVQAARFGREATSEWGRLRAIAREPIPMPCLSPCPQPQTVDLLDHVAFAQNSSSLSDPAKLALKSVLARQLVQATHARLVVRGHAHAGEARGIGLSRAKAVAAWLVKGGLAKNDIATVEMGTDYPLGSGQANRRVDFEVVRR